ncbi:MAG: hypothetical protein ACK55Z_17740, partial [bacterium]
LELYPHSPFGLMARLAATHKRAKTVLAGLDRARGPAPITDPLSRGFGEGGGMRGGVGWCAARAIPAYRSIVLLSFSATHSESNSGMQKEQINEIPPSACESERVKERESKRVY